MPTRRIPLTSALISALALLAGCGRGDDTTVKIVTIGAPASSFETGARLPPTAQLVRGAVAEGLVGLDAQGRVVSALADRWIVTDSGQSYIFRLRDGTWGDKSVITAESARRALIEAIARLRGTALALDLAGIDEIRVMAGRVIEIRLTRPMPHLLQLLAQPELGLLGKGRGAGPMRLSRDGDVALLRPIAPEDRGMPAVAKWHERVRTVRLSALSGERAVRLFHSGEADILLGGRIEYFPLASGVGISRGAIQLDPVSGLFGLQVTRAEGFLAEPENREVLALAIDRQALISAFGVSGWNPTTRIVAAGNDGDSGMVGERWAGFSIDELRQRAAARVARWRSGGKDAPRLTLALPQGPGANLLFARIRDDLGAAGITLVRAAPDAAADLRLIDIVARYPHVAWYLNQLSCAATRAVCSSEADALADKAATASDPAERAQLLADAEAELTKTNGFIPIGPPIRWSLVRGDASGFAVNRWGIHPLIELAMRPR